VTEIAQPSEVAANGIQSIVAHQSPVTRVWYVEDDNPYSDSGWQAYSGQFTLPRSYVIEVLEECDNFLRDLGLGISIKGGEIEDYGENRDPF
jgi:hypothetical protein